MLEEQASVALAATDLAERLRVSDAKRKLAEERLTASDSALATVRQDLAQLEQQAQHAKQSREALEQQLLKVAKESEEANREELGRLSTLLRNEKDHTGLLEKNLKQMQVELQNALTALEEERSDKKERETHSVRVEEKQAEMTKSLAQAKEEVSLLTKEMSKMSNMVPMDRHERALQSQQEENRQEVLRQRDDLLQTLRERIQQLNDEHAVEVTVLFCSVLFCSVLFCFVLFCSVLFCSVLFCSVMFCSVLTSLPH